MSSDILEFYIDKEKGRAPFGWRVKDGKVVKEEMVGEDVDDMKDDLRDLQNKLRDIKSYQTSDIVWKEDEYEALEKRIEKKRAAIKDIQSRTKVVDKHGSTLTQKKIGPDGYPVD